MSLNGTYDEGNVFARVLRGEIPVIKVFEDDGVLAFLDLYPQTRGHTLVVPKKIKARTFLDMPEAEVGPFLARVHRVARGVTKALKPDGVVITQFNGAPGGQTIFHVHFHIIPRYEGKALAGHGHANKADVAELESLAREIAAAI